MRTIKIKRGFTEPQTLLDGELGYDISSKTLYIGNGGGKDTLFVGGSVYPKIHADYNYYKKADANATEGYLEVGNDGRIPSSLVPATIHDYNQEEIFEVDYVYIPGTNPKQMFYMKSPYDFGTIAPGVRLGYDINGKEFDYLDLSTSSTTYISQGLYGEYFLVRAYADPGKSSETLQQFNTDTGQSHSAAALFLCRYDGHIYHINTNGEDYWVIGLSTPPDVIDGGTW